jgi:hypothetical protein
MSYEEEDICMSYEEVSNFVHLTYICVCLSAFVCLVCGVCVSAFCLSTCVFVCLRACLCARVHVRAEQSSAYSAV